MSSSRTDRIESLFQRAFDVPIDRRDAFLADQESDPAIRNEVVELLNAFDDKSADFLESPVVSLDDVADSPIEHIGAYAIDRELGRGGMGVVYEATDPALDRSIAIKVLTPIISLAPEWRRQFRDEAKILASINHPNIATVYSLEDAGGSAYITMEYVDGRLLSDVLRSGPMSLADALRIGQQMAAALEAAHRRGIVHRDLKPPNVMINRDDLVKVLDFGLARRVHEDSVDALKGAGTPGYMSPRQIRGDATSPADDAFAFGAILFECLTGVRAFGGATVQERLRATEDGTPPWSALSPDLPLPLTGLVRRLLDPLDDGPSMTDARRDIEQVIANRTVRRYGGRIADAGVPTNLPTPVSSFVGREPEMDDISSALDSHRVISLIGAGGCGKSRLALEVARRNIRAYPDGVWFVELASISDPDLVDSVVASAASVRPSPGSSPRDAIIHALTDRSVLLVLDNCEHVLDRASDLVNAIATRVDSASVLATSREPLSVMGSKVISVRPLDDDAVSLFADRAHAASGFVLNDASMPLVERICRRLDGIPLAIELAAARTNVLPLADISERLDDRFRLLTAGARTSLPHHRTLRALIDWSYEQLQPNEQQFFAALSVFVDSFSLAAAEAIAAGDALEAWEVLDVLSTLVGKSLVETVTDAQGDVRYRLLETIRAYAGDVLSTSARVTERYVVWYRDLAIELSEWVEAPDERQLVGHARFAAERPNIRRAAGVALAEPALFPHAAPLINQLILVDNITGALSEIRDLGERLLAHERLDSVPRREFGNLVHRLGNVASNQHDLDRANQLYSQAEAVWTELDNVRNLAGVKNNRGLAAQRANRLDDAKALFEQAMAINREAGHRDQESTNLNNLGIVAVAQGRSGDATRYYGEAVEIAREIGHPRYLSVFLSNYATRLQAEGDADGALQLQEEALSIRRQLGNTVGVSICLLNLASLERDRQRPGRALELLNESLRLKRDVGDVPGMFVGVEAVAQLAGENGRPEIACTIFAATRRLRPLRNVGCTPGQQREVDAADEHARSQLSAAEAEASRQTAESFALDDTIDLALSFSGDFDRASDRS